MRDRTAHDHDDADGCELQRLSDREQIGDDLRLHVIHRLFGLGLALQATAARITQPTQRAAVEDRISEVDAIIRDIRNVVYCLGTDSLRESPAAASDRGRDRDLQHR